ncbi:MAG: heliorhodopsin HeR [Patescibacteria group bacterium]|nr:heliorhodopsin HeR [Patescibacteria group bacterium]
MTKKLKGLRRFNLFMAFLHLIQGIVMLLISSNFSLPVMESFLRFNIATQKLMPDSQIIWNLQIGPAVAVFLFISAFFHLLISLPWFNEIYNRNLEKGINFYRWIEYSISSSVMILIIAMLVGIYDISALIALFGANASMILFGWMMELHNQSTEKTDWTSFIFGCIVGIIPWVAVAFYLFGAGGGENKAPDFVYWIYFSIFLFFNSFAINQVLQYKKVGKWKDYLFGEKVYIILSLVAKSLLAWQVFAGTLRP